MKLIFPQIRFLVYVSIFFFVITSFVLLVTLFQEGLQGFMQWFYFILILIALVPISYIYACGYFFALSFVKHVMKKKIFVAGKDPSKFFWKKVNYMMYPYTASILGAFLGFLGPAYYYHFKMMGEKKAGR